jgi:putative DNA primase/helicase
VLEEDDRRHAVIWHPPKLSQDFYREVKAEIDNGGPAALYHYLLTYPIPPDFHAGTEPPMTAAKEELIDLGRDNCILFLRAVDAGDLPPLKAQPGLSRDWYRCYRRWCQDEGLRPANHQRFSNILLRRRGVKVIKVRYTDGHFTIHGPARVMTIGAEPVFDGTRSESDAWGEVVCDTTDRANRYAGDIGKGAFDAAA